MTGKKSSSAGSAVGPVDAVRVGGGGENNAVTGAKIGIIAPLSVSAVQIATPSNPVAVESVVVLDTPFSPVKAVESILLSPVKTEPQQSPPPVVVVDATVAAAVDAPLSPVQAVVDIAPAVLSPVKAIEDITTSVFSPLKSTDASADQAPPSSTFATPVKSEPALPITPATVKLTGNEISFSDDSSLDDVTFKAHLFVEKPATSVGNDHVVNVVAPAPIFSPAKSPAPVLSPVRPSSPVRSVIPEQVRPAVTVVSPVLPDNAWLTPTKESPYRGNSVPIPQGKQSPALGGEPVATTATAVPSTPIAVSELNFGSPTQNTPPAPSQIAMDAALNSSFQSPEDGVRDEEEPGDASTARMGGLLWGDGALSPIREETDEYTSDVSSSTEVRLSMVPGSAATASLVTVTPQKATVEVPATPPREPAPVVVAAIATPEPGVAAAPPVAKVTPAPQHQQDVLQFPTVSPLLTTPAAQPEFKPVTPLVTSPVQQQGTPMQNVPSAATPVATPPSALQAELARIKQRIRVWDVTSPVKSGAAASPLRVDTRMQTPEKLPKYSEAEMLAAKTEAEQAALAENERLKAEYAALQQKYEQEKGVNKQLRDVVDEFETTVKVMVEGHAKELEAERTTCAQLVSQNTELMALVEDRQRRCDALEREHLEVAKELDEARQVHGKAQENLAVMTRKLEDTTNKYQALKQQAEKKLALANERIQQQHSVNSEQIALIKQKLAGASAQVEQLTGELAKKKKENVELVSICDLLVSQLEAAKK